MLGIDDRVRAIFKRVFTPSRTSRGVHPSWDGSPRAGPGAEFPRVGGDEVGIVSIEPWVCVRGACGGDSSGAPGADGSFIAGVRSSVLRGGASHTGSRVFAELPGGVRSEGGLLRGAAVLRGGSEYPGGGGRQGCGFYGEGSHQASEVHDAQDADGRSTTPAPAPPLIDRASDT